MSSIKKMELEVELKSPADALWNTMKDINVLYPKLFSEEYKSIEILEGDGRSAGSVRFITYNEGNELGIYIIVCLHVMSILGDTETSKIEYVDEDKKPVSYSVLEGRLLKLYKSFQEITTVKPAPAPGNGCVVAWTCAYEMLPQGIPVPDSIKDSMIQLFHKLDDYTLANYNNN